MSSNTAFPLQDHKQTIRSLFDEVWSRGDFEHVHEYVAQQVTFHFRGRTLSYSPEDLIRIVGRWRTAFPDLQFEIGTIVAEQDMAAAWLTHRGTHKGVWKGIAPTGRTIEVEEMMFFRFEHGRIAEVWEVVDEHTQLQQLTQPEN